MENNRIENTNYWIKMFFVCMIGFAINMLGYMIVNAAHLPIYLDSVGTVIIAAIGGYLPGIIAGLATNLLKGAIYSTENVYYAVINVLIAVCTGYFSRRGLLKKPLSILGYVCVLSLIGFGHYTLFQWFTNDIYEGIDSLRAHLYNDMFYEVLDKSVTTIILLLVLKFVPQNIKNKLKMEGWLQTPLSEEEIEAVKQRNSRVFSLKSKILFLLISACVAVGVVAMIITVVLYRKYTIEEHEKMAQGTTSLIKSVIDPDAVDMYIEEGEKAPGYIETEQRLYNIKNSSSDIQYLYVYKIMEDGCHVVFDLDTEDLEGGNPGEVIPFDESFGGVIPTLLEGGRIDPIVTDDTYGYLITVYDPIYDSKGNCKCYAATDIAMNLVKTKELSFMMKLVSLFLGFFIFVIALGLWLSEYNIILPVNTMAVSASAFAYDSEEALEENVERIKRLQIHTGDEIENMYQAFYKTTENSVEYLNELHTKTETIAEMQNALIMVLADMVENRDENTGDHVRKTAAYTRIIMDKLLEMNCYVDQLTPQFIYDVEHSAPLHDVGKIQVSDTILNKPGKLTDEEFAIMKTHTTAGAEILDQVIEKVPESSYLIEAKNLAEFHHEKWNGKGYPYGLKGEEIPLSARIMAVADVFDALVSERIYKKAFPFEKAMNIIKEDAGTHFDPNVAEAFIQSADRVREVMDYFNEQNNSTD
ncbi:HD domain-containing protein [Lachnospiraceae bacterium]|nr:HD domain-containing protein [Lachnospiraceae bacterium]